ncbi:MAG: FAD-binding oxidoreductase [Gammaproteobacteria bacterium]
MTSPDAAPSPSPGLPAALAAWAALLGAEHVLDGAAASGRYGACTLRSGRTVSAALRPGSVDDVVRALAIAGQHGVALYPVSTGNNWGYGSANPPRAGSVVLDLSRMNRIVEMDEELGFITVEPGVTQGQLHQYLRERKLPFLVPAHGGGPDCSLIGNAVERGYGITPYADHFAAVMALEAVLPDGRVYRSGLAEAGGTLADKAFKWGVGPYLDGLFTQSGFGVVTRMTIALAQRPESTMAFFFSLADDRDLEEAVLRVRDTLRTVSGVVGSVNLMNRRRVLSMMVPYPREQVPPGGIVPTALVERLGRHHQVLAWTGAGALYGPGRVVAGAKAAVAHCLKPLVKRLVFVSGERLRPAKALVEAVPLLARGRLGNIVTTLDKTLRLLDGEPSDIALPLAYWKTPARRPATGDMNPARDGCGLLWYAPLVPMKAAITRSFVTMAESVCVKHGMEPLITLTSLSDRCFDSTVPLLFDQDDAGETARAHACLEELLTTGQQLGFSPYRVGIESMAHVVRPDTTFWQLAGELKRTVDAGNLLAPGRYSLD